MSKYGANNEIVRKNESHTHRYIQTNKEIWSVLCKQYNNIQITNNDDDDASAI